MGLCWDEPVSGRRVLHLWLNALPRHCSPSLRRVLDFIAFCSLALFMTNSTFNSTCADNGPVNEYVYVCMYVCMLPSTPIVSDCWGSNICLINEGLAHHTTEHCIIFMHALLGAHTKMIEATLKHAKFTSGLTKKTSLY